MKHRYLYVRPSFSQNYGNQENSLDYSAMNGKWFQSDAVADLNKDGIVNALDFSLLNKNWMRQGD
jgi:hypothetical protein